MMTSKDGWVNIYRSDLNGGVFTDGEVHASKEAATQYVDYFLNRHVDREYVYITTRQLTRSEDERK